MHAGRLLIEIHPDDQRLTETVSHFDKVHPGGMNPQDVADHQFLTRGLGEFCNFLGFRDRIGQKLFDEDVTACIQRQLGIGGVGITPGVNGYDIALCGGEGFGVVRKKRRARNSFWISSRVSMPRLQSPTISNPLMDL